MIRDDKALAGLCEAVIRHLADLPPEERLARGQQVIGHFAEYAAHEAARSAGPDGAVRLLSIAAELQRDPVRRPSLTDPDRQGARVLPGPGTRRR